ncbi:MAG: D-alanyl-D-alanine carboxypeptidase family protein [Christensenella sp.]
MKKAVAWIIAFVLILTIPITAFAEKAPETTAPAQVDAEPTPTPVPTPVPTPTPAETAATKEGAPAVDMEKINAISAMLVDADTGEVLFSKNADWTIFPASTTKLMTAMLVAEKCKPEDIVTLTPEIMTEVNKLGTKGSLMGLRNLKVGTTISVKDLFYGLMMCSGNDAAVVLSMQVAGTEQAFIDLMNARAKELGMTGTHFINSYGIYIANVGHDHYSTAADMAKLGMAAYKMPFITEVMAAKQYKYESVSGLCSSEALGDDTIESSNYLINTPAVKPYCADYLYDKATGMKTGTLDNILPPGATEYTKSYGCLVASASDNGFNLIAVIFGDLSLKEEADGAIVHPQANARWDIAKYLFEYGFTNYVKVDLAKYVSEVALTEKAENFSNNDPQKGEFDVAVDLSGIKTDERLMDAVTVKGLEDGSIKLEEKIDIKEPLEAPIAAGEQVGTVTYSLNGEKLYTAPLAAGRDVYKKGEEAATSEKYNVPLFTFEAWHLLLIIPAAVVLLLFILRLVNKARRRARYVSRGSVRTAKVTATRSGSNVRNKNASTRSGRRNGD